MQVLVAGSWIGERFRTGRVVGGRNSWAAGACLAGVGAGWMWCLVGAGARWVWAAERRVQVATGKPSPGPPTLEQDGSAEARVEESVL